MNSEVTSNDLLLDCLTSDLDSTADLVTRQCPKTLEEAIIFRVWGSTRDGNAVYVLFLQSCTPCCERMLLIWSLKCHRLDKDAWRKLELRSSLKMLLQNGKSLLLYRIFRELPPISMNFFRKYGMQVDKIAYCLLKGSSMEYIPDWSVISVITQDSILLSMTNSKS